MLFEPPPPQAGTDTARHAAPSSAATRFPAAVNLTDLSSRQGHASAGTAAAAPEAGSPCAGRPGPSGTVGPDDRTPRPAADTAADSRRHAAAGLGGPVRGGPGAAGPVGGPAGVGPGRRARP